MVIIYQAANSLDAYMIKGLLEQYDIPAYVQGEHLQSGVGLLPAVAGFIKVSVDNKNQAEAEQVISDWQSSDDFISEEKEEEKVALSEKDSGSNQKWIYITASLVVSVVFINLLIGAASIYIYLVYLKPL